MKLTNIVKRYPGCTVFENFSLDIAEGEVTCLLGPSGAGKTTLLNILAGLTPCEGGVPKVGCSYIFQQPRLVPNLTVRGNLRLVFHDKNQRRRFGHSNGSSEKNVWDDDSNRVRQTLAVLQHF